MKQEPGIWLAEGDCSVHRDGFAVAHCVGQDMTLGKGFAKELVRNFGRPQSRAKIGEVVTQLFPCDNFTVSHMITKPQSSVPGSKYRGYLGALKSALKMVMERAPKSQRVIVPHLIGTGLDGYTHDQVMAVIREVVSETKRPIGIVRLF